MTCAPSIAQLFNGSARARISQLESSYRRVNSGVVETLEQYSGIALYSSVVVYSLALVFYAVDLAGRSGATDRESHKRSRSVNIGFSLTVLGFVLHAGATVLRGIAAERVPWANMYEFALTATLAAVLAFLVVQFFVDLRFLGTLVTGLAVLFLMVAKVNYYVPVVPLQDALNSYWLVIHILVAVLAVGLFTLSFGLSVLQLLQSRRARVLTASNTDTLKMLRGFPDSNRLENLSYRMTVVGFVLWTFTLIAGSIWAEAAWGRYWGWDTKEVWTFVVWVLYAGYIHARATRGWRGTPSAWLNIVGYAAVIFNFTIVNQFFPGLHSYSGL